MAPLLGIVLADGVLEAKVGRRVYREKEGAHPLEVERKTWLAFYEAFTLSIAHQTAVVLG